MKSIVLLVAALTMTVYSCVNNASTEVASSSLKMSADRLNRIDTLVNNYIDNHYISGAVAYIARDGKIAYYRAFGMDDADQNKEMKKDAIFRIASQTKAITSVAVMILYEEGKFLLDD